MNRNIIFILLALILLPVIPLTAQVNQEGSPQNWQVIDGDTIRHGERVIRLWGIDAPEINQRCLDHDGSEYQCGVASKTTLELLIQDKPLTCSFISKDRYRREVAKCYLENIDIGGLMVSLGQAIDYRRYSKGHYAAEQYQAQKKGLGLWKGEFEEPDDYRRNRTAL